MPSQFEFPKIEQLNTGHGRFYRTPEGNVYPSVTTVLGAQQNDSLAAWKKSVGEEEAKKISERATSRGTRIHKYIEDYLTTGKVNIRSIFDRVMFESLVPSLSEIEEIFVIEQGLYSDYLKSAGTVDLAGKFRGKRSIIDFKTSRNPKYKDQVDGYFTQASAYAVAWEERTGQPITQLVIMIAVDQDVPQIFVDHRDNWINSYIEIRRNYNGNYTET